MVPGTGSGPTSGVTPDGGEGAATAAGSIVDGPGKACVVDDSVWVSIVGGPGEARVVDASVDGPIVDPSVDGPIVDPSVDGPIVADPGVDSIADGTGRDITSLVWIVTLQPASIDASSADPKWRRNRIDDGPSLGRRHRTKIK